jgi:2-dehydropantoate 2-reductase
MNPVGALTVSITERQFVLRLRPRSMSALLQEGKAVATALGITLYGDVRKMVAEGAKTPHKRNASMLQDVLAGRPTEVDFINGAIADLGEKLGVPVPLNGSVWRLMKGLEHSWTDPK